MCVRVGVVTAVQRLTSLRGHVAPVTLCQVVFIHLLTLRCVYSHLARRHPVCLAERTQLGHMTLHEETIGPTCLFILLFCAFVCLHSFLFNITDEFCRAIGYSCNITSTYLLIEPTYWDVVDLDETFGLARQSVCQVFTCH